VCLFVFLLSTEQLDSIDLDELAEASPTSDFSGARRTNQQDVLPAHGRQQQQPDLQTGMFVFLVNHTAAALSTGETIACTWGT